MKFRSTASLGHFWYFYSAFTESQPLHRRKDESDALQSLLAGMFNDVHGVSVDERELRGKCQMPSSASQ